MERLDKLLAEQGMLSRSQARELIRSGRVQVNGEIAKSPDRKVAETDTVMAAGRELRVKKYTYIMMNKPVGTLSATRDRRAPTVLDIIPEELRRKGLFPAGRLDKDTEGFLLITNDGDLAHRLLAPKSHVPKTYRAVLNRPIEDEALLMEEFAHGVALDGGDQTSPAQLHILQNGEQPQIELVIYEGMYHQVKRMFERFDYSVIRLKRVGMGGLALDPTLEPGQCRELSDKELRALQP